jgi:uncharacterized protein
MKENNKGVMILVVVLILVFLLPWGRINWGKVRWMQPETVTVTGEAKSTQKNQIATFNAGVDAVNSDKDKAINDVNGKMEAIIAVIKDFGIKEEDIKTQNLSIFQQEETYYEGGVQRSRKGQWRVSNGVEIVLREVDKASKLTSLLTSTGANNVYGPNFSFDDVSETQKGLYEAAMKDAKDKAEMLVKVSGRRLGKVVNVSESGNSPVYPVYRMAADGLGGGGTPVEPGSGTVRQSLVVVFELE